MKGAWGTGGSSAKGVWGENGAHSRQSGWPLSIGSRRPLRQSTDPGSLSETEPLSTGFRQPQGGLVMQGLPIDVRASVGRDRNRP